ncbi:glycosyltransferase, partial [bacterium]|nr:glycosyltransferase [bacterium]
MKIFVVIPAFNEEKRIAQVLTELSNFSYQVVVVDDSSSDKTSQVASQFQVAVLQHKINRGQGAALRTGTDYAISKAADIIVHFDADGQFLVKEIKKIIEPLEKSEAEIVFGSRFLDIKSDIYF